MVKELDTHMADCGSSFGLGGLLFDFSSVSGECTCPIAKLKKRKNNNNSRIKYTIL